MADRAGLPGGGDDVESFLDAERRHVEAALEALVPGEDEPPSLLHRAMRYSLLAGGKRLRPILLLTSGRACGAEREPLLPAACAVELVHTYSLIHDDLPAFDNDDLRRGRPTNHVVFGEAIAVLAGDALHTLAFALLARSARDSGLPAERGIEAIHELATAAGSSGMAGGQCIDLQSEGEALDLESLRRLHAAKTGALLTACVRIGAILAGADPGDLDRLTRYGRAVGLAFQIVDDVLDVEGSLRELGKRPGGDASRGKSTYATLLGVEAARAEARRLRDEALAAIEPLGERGCRLAALADFTVERRR